jgi:hypothetical protein
MDEQSGNGETRSAVKVPCGSAIGLERMSANGVRSLRPGSCGLRLQCLSGLVIVTQKGDHLDHELHPGDEFRTAKRGLVVAWALWDSEFAVNGDSSASGPRKAA